MVAAFSVWTLIEDGFTTLELIFAVLFTGAGVHYANLAWRVKRARDAGGTAPDVEH